MASSDLIRLICIDQSGVERTFAGTQGTSVMETLVQHGVGGIEAECGGFMACATCHVYVDGSWIDAVGRADRQDNATEAELLDDALAQRKPESRLSCQINLEPALSGLRVTVPTVNP